MKQIRHLLELIRFSHTLFALPFALWAALIAWTYAAPGRSPPPFRVRDLVGILVCMVAARSAAMAFNRWADRYFDAENPRTRQRHLPAGILSERSVVLFTCVSSAMFWAGTFLFWPNPLPPLLAPFVLAFLLGYSYSKRFTALSHFWLGASLMMAPISTWIALRGQEILADPRDLAVPFLLGGAVLSWVAGFDIIYACQDADFDRRAKLHSIPARLGVANALRVAAVCHAVTVLLLALLPLCFPTMGLGIIYEVSLVGIALLLVLEHCLVRPDDLTRVNVAFFYVNVAVSMGLLIIGGLDLLF
jgi:4-hydroxybenzoate polyprenyltransferase